MKKLFLLVLVMLGQGCVFSSKNNSPDPAPIISGSYLSIVGRDITENTLRGKDSDLIKISGQTFVLPTLNTTIGIAELKSQKSYTHYFLSDGKYNQTRFGLLEKKEKTMFPFYQGYATTEMPQTGNFIYDGEAVVSLSEREGWGRYLGIASATSNVNFAQKTVTVKITTPEATPREIHFGATIHGNTFSGDQGFISDGGFYGANAAELSGYFIDQKNNFGVFGGKKPL